MHIALWFLCFEARYIRYITSPICNAITVSLWSCLISQNISYLSCNQGRAFWCILGSLDTSSNICFCDEIEILLMLFDWNTLCNWLLVQRSNIALDQWKFTSYKNVCDIVTSFRWIPYWCLDPFTSRCIIQLIFCRNDVRSKKSTLWWIWLNLWQRW